MDSEITVEVFNKNTEEVMAKISSSDIEAGRDGLIIAKFYRLGNSWGFERQNIYAEGDVNTSKSDGMVSAFRAATGLANANHC